MYHFSLRDVNFHVYYFSIAIIVAQKPIRIADFMVYYPSDSAIVAYFSQLFNLSTFQLRQVVITYEVHAKNPELRDLASDCRSLSLADM